MWVGCPGKRYGTLHGGGVSLAIVTFVMKICFVPLDVDMKLIALTAIPVWGYISTEFERKMSADSTTLR